MVNPLMYNKEHTKSSHMQLVLQKQYYNNNIIIVCAYYIAVAITIKGQQ